MSDITNRNRIESALAREIAKINAPALRKLITALGDPPSLNNVPDSFWTNYSAEMRAVLNTMLQQIYVTQAETMASEHGITASVNWNQINQDAADWASGYSFELVKGINETTTSALQSIISKGIEQTQTVGEITAAIRDSLLFSPERASMIATTELTRAAAEGEAATVAQIADNGIALVPIWMNREDNLVCPVCLSLDGVTGEMVNGAWSFHCNYNGEDYGLPPDSHPNCRCAIGWKTQ